MISFFLFQGEKKDTLGNSSFTSITGHKIVIGNDSLTNSFWPSAHTLHTHALVHFHRSPTQPLPQTSRAHILDPHITLRLPNHTTYKSASPSYTIRRQAYVCTSPQALHVHILPPIISHTHALSIYRNHNTHTCIQTWNPVIYVLQAHPPPNTNFPHSRHFPHQWTSPPTHHTPHPDYHMPTLRT